MKIALKLLLVLLVLLCMDILERTWAESIPSLGKCGQVHLTVSCLENLYLELNWITRCDNPEEAPDRIAIYSKHPEIAKKPIQSIKARKYNGYFVTSVKFIEPWTMDGSKYYKKIPAKPNEHCFPYWIASKKGRTIIDINCLRIRPYWMNDSSSVLGPQRIGSIFIPGTHNSGTSRGMSELMAGFTLNQNANIWSQLVFGIRYLDLRVGYYKEEGFYINHDIIPITRLKPVLNEIARFVKIAPKEIIIVDFHRFPIPKKFNKSIHKKLVQIIKRKLGRFAFTYKGYENDGPTLNEIWQENKNLIICYGEREISDEYDWLWPPMKQYWGDIHKVAHLKPFLKSAVESHSGSNSLEAIMAELTITPLQVIAFVTIKDLADIVNRKLTKWFRDEWWRDTGIVATDYFLGNDLINVAIEANKFK